MPIGTTTTTSATLTTTTTIEAGIARIIAVYFSVYSYPPYFILFKRRKEDGEFFCFSYVLFYLGCNDKLPADYGGNYIGYGSCTWTCDKWATNGECNVDWNDHSHCVNSTRGPIKNYCKMSCNQCGRYRVF